MRMIGIVAAALTTAVAIPTASLACDTVWHVALSEWETDELVQRIEEVADGVETYASDRLCFEIFARGELGYGFDLVEQISRGTVQIGALAWETVMPVAPSLMVLGFPFAFKDYDQVHAYWETTLANTVAGELEDDGLRLLGLWDTSFAAMAANERLDSPNSLDGSTILRVAPGPLREALEDRATVIGFGIEPVRADAEEIILSEIRSEATMTRVTNYSDIVLTRHRYEGLVVLASQEAYDSLPQDEQMLLHDLVAQVKPVAREEAEARVAENLGYMKEIGTSVHELDFEDRLRWVWAFGACPNCAGKGRTCSRDRCPCDSGCEREGDKQCCNPASMPAPPGYEE